MKITQQQLCNRLTLVKTIAAVDPKEFNVQWWESKCGARACAYGHYRRATKARLHSGTYVGNAELKAEFGLSSEDTNDLFFGTQETPAEWLVTFKTVLEREATYAD